MKALLLILAASLSVHASETTKGVQKDYEAFKQEMSAKIEVAEKKLQELKANTKETGKEAREKTITELEATRDDLKTKLSKAQEKTKTNWSAFKKSFAESVDSLNSKIQDAMKK